ncbi:ABC transporter substrate-binding protein [Micromonospora craniellae]|uniref:ABC transporter substrate-binding protein n=1 Tax=Micromonospora craniellae TaxID=2294034 RepID=A0A372FYX5_9ACTN|nr:ABC transporter substrate-binding protein [Micromonospora craniellae]QOC93451.1 ABC transporter substrate-binding protein [Micromonospora craniellae]RFS45898.1 ABC transporter substrate-binding protein [Micromonospora craniellae]
MVSITTRRLVAAVAVGAALAAAGCSGDPDDGGQASAGGTLRAAFAGGGSSETLNYLVGPTPLDYVRAKLVHPPLCELDPQAPDGVAYGVVESITVSDDRRTYTLKVRNGVTFTSGKAMTSADVLYSLRAPTVLNGLPFTRIISRNFDVEKASAPDATTVILPTLSPIADGREVICQSMLAIPDGTTEFTPDTPSAGAFTIETFEPGRSTLLKRNDAYYGEKPSLERIELLSIIDGTARVNALRQGQVDFISGIGPAQARTLEGVDAVEVSTSELPYAAHLQFTMNTATKPFDDPRVREAFRLAVDRERIVANVYFGRAFVGNDVPALGFPSYDRSLTQRTPDRDRAKQLLAEAGASGMTVELTAGPEMPGMVETAALVVEDLKAIGVQATVRELPAGQLFADYPAYLSWPFKAGWNPPAFFEINHTPGTFPDVDALVLQARGAATRDERLAASHRAQKLLWEKGNQIAPVFVPTINAGSDKVDGVRNLQFPDLIRATIRT